MKRWLILASVLTVFSVLASFASALTIDAGTGEVTNWGITPFTDLTQDAVVTNLAPGVTSYLQNDWSPLNYPGIGHVPSPGGSTGELFDLEEMHVRRDGQKLQMLLVASSLFGASGGGSTFHLGDLLMNIDDDAEFDVALVTQMSNAGLNAGGLYEILTTRGLQQKSGSYYGTPIADEVGPWAAQTGILVPQAEVVGPIVTDSHDYGGSEGTTYLYELTMDFGPLGGLPDNVDFQMAWGCGNDVIKGTYNIPGEQSEPIDGIPEPATAVMGLMALAGIAKGVGGRGRRVSKA